MLSRGRRQSLQPVFQQLNRSGLRARYVPDTTGTRVAGEFAKSGPSGACYAVTFSAGRTWVTDGDPSGLLVAGPQVAPSTRCAARGR